MEPRGNKLIFRYKKNYNIPAEADITEKMILTHWELEKELTSELLQSKPEERWETFDRCYTRLYSELKWLNQFSDQANSISPQKRFREWLNTIGSSPKIVYEIGSGKGDLISYLAQNGFKCKATEITRERGQKHLTDSYSNLSWGISDGVHLEKFESPKTYDIIISNQVIEHIHPEDLKTHFEGAHCILKEGGKYVFSTPHCYTGPHDVSRVFGHNEPKGMHLKEYLYSELSEVTNRAGFSRIYCAFTPKSIHTLLISLGFEKLVKAHSLGVQYLQLQIFIEKLLSLIPNYKSRYLCVKLLKKVYIFSDNIYLVAEK